MSILVSRKMSVLLLKLTTYCSCPYVYKNWQQNTALPAKHNQALIYSDKYDIQGQIAADVGCLRNYYLGRSSIKNKNEIMNFVPGV